MPALSQGVLPGLRNSIGYLLVSGELALLPTVPFSVFCLVSSLLILQWLRGPCSETSNVRISGALFTNFGSGSAHVTCFSVVTEHAHGFHVSRHEAPCAVLLPVPSCPAPLLGGIVFPRGVDVSPPPSAQVVSAVVCVCIFFV